MRLGLHQPKKNCTRLLAKYINEYFIRGTKVEKINSQKHWKSTLRRVECVDALTMSETLCFRHSAEGQKCKRYKDKGRYSSLWEPHLRATGRHLPYGITQCYLPPDTSERALP